MGRAFWCILGGKARVLEQRATARGAKQCERGRQGRATYGKDQRQRWGMRQRLDEIITGGQGFRAHDRKICGWAAVGIGARRSMTWGAMGRKAGAGLTESRSDACVPRRIQTCSCANRQFSCQEPPVHAKGEAGPISPPATRHLRLNATQSHRFRHRSNRFYRPSSAHSDYGAWTH